MTDSVITVGCNGMFWYRWACRPVSCTSDSGDGIIIRFPTWCISIASFLPISTTAESFPADLSGGSVTWTHFIEFSNAWSHGQVAMDCQLSTNVAPANTLWVSQIARLVTDELLWSRDQSASSWDRSNPIWVLSLSSWNCSTLLTIKLNLKP